MGFPCSSCGTPIAAGSAICTVCGTNQETGEQLGTTLMKAPKVKAAKAPRQKREFNPTIAAVVLVAFFGVLLVLGFSSPGAAVAYFAFSTLLGLVAYIAAVVFAFKDEDKGWGLIILSNLVPILNIITVWMTLFYVFCRSGRGSLKMLWAVSILVSLCGLLLMSQIEAFLPEQP
jgi:hypothetical protein